MRPEDRVLPLAAVVGHEPVKLALRLLAINPGLGGLLIRGEKGTAKSTLARGLARLLPERDVHVECSYGCAAGRPEHWCDDCLAAGGERRTELRRAPFETLPLGIGEDELLGSLDLEQALREGRRRFEPGLLARVNGGVLYVDEVNLLDDHLVDLLLDAAASQVNVVSREGITISHPAELLLIGTMNPEEGELRPQLQDRFGLCTDLSGLRDPDARAEVVSRCLEFERDPAAFAERWAEEERSLAERLAAARRRLPGMTVARRWLEAAAELSLALEVDGHRADLLLVKAALTAAALRGRDELVHDDLERVAPLVYSHRLKRRPLEEAAPGAEELRQRAREVLGGSKKAAAPAGGSRRGR